MNVQYLPAKVGSSEGLGVVPKRPAELMSALKGSGREIRLSWPDDISTREIEYLMEIVALQMKTYRRIAQLREAGVRAAGDLEWNSWFPDGHTARVAEPNNSEGLNA